MCHCPYSLLHISIWNYMKSFRCTPLPVALKSPGFNPDWIYCRTCDTGYPCLLVYPTLYQPRLKRQQESFDYFSHWTQRSGILDLVKGKTIDHRLGWWWRRLWKNGHRLWARLQMEPKSENRRWKAAFQGPDGQIGLLRINNQLSCQLGDQQNIIRLGKDALIVDNAEQTTI